MSDGLPNGWSEHQLGEIAELFNGKAGGTGGTWLRVFKTRHVYDGFLRLTDPAFAPDEKALKVPPSSFLRSGDTLTPNMAHGTIGRVSFVREAEDKWTVDGQVMVIRPKTGAVIGRYLFDWMSRPESKRQLVGMEKGGAFDELRGQTHIYRSDVGGIRVWLPPLAEQEKIAAILSSVDDAIEATQKVIDQIQIVKKAMMAELLTRGLPGRHTKFKMTEIGEIPEEWDVARLQDVADVIDPNPKHRNPAYTKDGFPFISTQEFLDPDDLLLETPRRVSLDTVEEQEQRCRFSQDSLVFSRKGTIGKTRRLPTGLRFALLDSLCVVNPSTRVRVDYLLEALRGPLVTTQIAAATMGVALQQVSVGRVRELRIPIPTVDEQAGIGRAMASVTQRLRSEMAGMEGMHSVKAALMSVLLTGEVRVKPGEEAA